MELKKNGSKRFKGMIVVRKDSDIKELSDLKGCKIAFVDENSTIGYHFFRAEMADAGIHEDDLAGSNYLGSHTKVAEAVVAGDYDAGAVKESTYDEYKEHLRVIKEFDNVTKPLIAREGLPQEVISALKSALLGLKDREVLKESKISGFAETSDSEYDFVRRRMKEAESFITKKKK
jgi:phosphonate transport system substrate-binding protein